MQTRKITRTRIGAALGLVAALAVGLVVTSHRSHERTPVKVARRVASAPPSTVISDRRADEFRQLQALIPDHSFCNYDPKADIADLQCTRDGVRANYFLASAAKLDSAYSEIAGANRHHSLSGPSPCASGHQDERAWATAAHPRVVAGRFSCQFENGRPTIYWTVPRRGLIARAEMTKGNLAELFAWWTSHSERWGA